MPRKTYVQDKETGKWVERIRHRSTSHFVRGDVEPFVSPVDGTVIGSASQLRDHNKRNDVVSMDDWGNQSDYVKRDQASKAAEDAHVRKQKIIHAVEQNRGNVYNTFQQYVDNYK